MYNVDVFYLFPILARPTLSIQRFVFEFHIYFFLFASEEQSEITFTYTLENGHLTANYKADVKFYPEMSRSFKLDVTHSRTASAMTHNGSLEITSSQGTIKAMWNAGSNGNMCKTGYSLTKDSQEVVSYSHMVRRPPKLSNSQKCWPLCDNVQLIGL